MRFTIILILLLVNHVSFGQCKFNNTPPLNDHYSDAISLSIGQKLNGYTCCSNGYTDTPNRDFPNIFCPQNMADDVIWYKYSSHDERGLTLKIEPINSNRNYPINVEILKGSSQMPSLVLYSPNTYVSSSNTSNILVNCNQPDEHIWIKISSSDLYCNEFSLFIDTIIQCPSAETCFDVLDTIFLAPTDPDCGDYIFTSVQGCLENALPESNFSFCGHDTLPTVWFKVFLDTNAVQFQTKVKKEGSWKPMWSVYAGSCDSLIVVTSDSRQDSVNCVDVNRNGNYWTFSAYQGYQIYYVAFSGIGNIDNPYFNIEFTTSAQCVPCVGNNECKPEAIWNVTKRSSTKQLDDLEFIPGEEVTLCIDFEFDASESGMEWLHGMIPDFGPGWDMDNFNPSDIEVTPSMPTWSSANDGICAPITNEKLPYACTYVDDFGILRMCNTLCNSCPCVPPVQAGSALPSGWFWTSEGKVGCANDCSPSSKFGIGSMIVDVHFCMNLNVKTFQDIEDCNQNRDLSVDFNLTSDGVSGCWNDMVAECKYNYQQFSPDFTLSCDFTDVSSVHSPLFQITPNPTSQDLSISGDVIIKKVLITNGMGQIIDSLNFNNSQSSVNIPVSSLPPGIYFLHIVTLDGKNHVQKVYVQS